MRHEGSKIEKMQWGTGTIHRQPSEWTHGNSYKKTQECCCSYTLCYIRTLHYPAKPVHALSTLYPLPCLAALLNSHLPPAEKHNCLDGEELPHRVYVHQLLVGRSARTGMDSKQHR